VSAQEDARSAVRPLRISSLRICTRMTVYYGLGTPARERYEKERRVLFSGHRIGHDYLTMMASPAHEEPRLIWVASGPDEWVIPRSLLAEREEDATIWAEVPVQWEFGVGHIDAFLPGTGTALEILSSASASGQMVHSKLLQLTLYILNYPAAERGELLIVDPRDYSEERVIIETSDRKFAALREEALDRVEQLHRWRSTGELPPRVCRHPRDSETWWCRVSETCFADWEEPIIPLVADEDAAAVLARKWVELKEREADPKAKIEALIEDRKAVEEELATLVAPGVSIAREFRINRSPRSRRNFKMKLAELDSRFPDELLSEFSSESSWDVYTIDRVGTEDFGEDPPF
jgi:hypothetical protein